MANAGNEKNDAYWAPEHVVHSSQNQQQFNAPEGPIPAASNSYFHPNAAGDPHGMSYGGHPPPGETNFTVLSDGFGNFLKVYHQPTEDVHLANPAGKQEYELFASNNSYMRPAPGFGFLFPQQQQQQPSVPKATNASHHMQQPNAAQSEAPGTNTSMLINQLVGNWAPTISGTYSPFGGGGPSLLAEGLPRSSEDFVQQQHQQPVQQQPAQQIPQQQTQQQHHVHPQQLPNQVQEPQSSPVRQPVTNNSSVSSPSSPQSPPQQQQQASPVNVSPTASYNNQLNDDNSAKLNQNVKKQRIVAEVKPMRMSYSDVLSKNVVASATATHSSPSSGSSTLNGGNAAGNSNVSSGKSNASSNALPSGGNGGYSSGGGGSKSSKADKAQSKKTPLQHGGSMPSDDKANRKVERNTASGVHKKSALNVSNSSASYHYVENSPVQKATVGQSGTDKTARKIEKPAVKTAKGRPNESLGLNSSFGRKNRSRNFNDEYSVQDAINKESTREDTEDMEDDDDEDEDEDEEDFEEYEDDSSQQQQPFMYNVKKNNNPNDTHIEKISGSRSSYKRGGRGSGTGRTKLEKSYQQPTAKRGQKPRKNQKYMMIQKIANTWLEFMVFAVTWLWSLVSDVVYLSFRLCWDYLIAGYQYCKHHFLRIKQECQQNRPGTWLKGVWKSIDSRFAKDSKWVFWRGKKKSAPVEEQMSSGRNYYKDGRLPSTADEAMSSLLNCKGKDAYSILGVSPDCSQEQIRKHYKKIAVLVHPDKNKQPGAEEAFKVLQRSFELIGEPENRQIYDQSLAEAMHAEKAWSEINDLLTQLHTKISEAANTIRCSSCCLRHPRKSTGRPQYAARECNSCKIRHSAREGDIWAETSFFGLRWKYLAMMEGNVYDITEWANCQKGALSHLQPNSHIVQYRIVLGGNSQQQQQQGNQQQSDKDPTRSRKDGPTSEPNLDDFLNNIYGGQNQQQQQQAQGGTRRRHRRN